MSLGIRRVFDTIANLVVTSSAAPITTGLTTPIAAGQRVHFKVYLPFSVGATGGIRVLIAAPAVTRFNANYQLDNTVAPSIATAQQVATGTAFTNAVANAGNHCVLIEGTIVASAAGDLDIQVAQNTSDALSMTLLAGAWMDVTVL